MTPRRYAVLREGGANLRKPKDPLGNRAGLSFSWGVSLQRILTSNRTEGSESRVWPGGLATHEQLHFEARGEIGRIGQDVTVTATDVETRTELGGLTWTNVEEYSKEHPWRLLVEIVLTLGSPFLGLVFAGGVGVFVGLAIGAVVLSIGHRDIARVRNEKGGKTN